MNTPTDISMHFEMMMPLEVQEQTGTTSDLPEHIRVLRLLSEYNSQQTELQQAQAALAAVTLERDEAIAYALREK